LAGQMLLAETLTGDAPAGDMLPPGELAEPLGPAG
jgi:hypothetical protein